MTPERWLRVSELCEQALRLEPGERAAFLQLDCAEDEDLRTEVESLLAFEPAAQSFLECPAAAALASPSEPLHANPGPTVTHLESGAHGDAARRFRQVALFAAVVSIVAAGFTSRAIWHAAIQDFGWETGLRHDVVASIQRGGSADGILQRGDRVLAIDGDTRVAAIGTSWKRPSLSAARPYAVDLERDGTIVSVALETRPLPAGRLASVGRLLVGLAWCALGVFVGWSRPSLDVARVTAIGAFSLGLMLMRASLYPALSGGDVVSARTYGLLLLNEPWPPALAYHALSLFPHGISTTRLWTGLRVVVYLTSMVLVPGAVAAATPYLSGPDAAMAVQRAFPPFLVSLSFQSIASVGIGAAAVAVAIRNLHTLSGPSQRLHVRWVIVSAVVCLVLLSVSTLRQSGPHGFAAIADISTVVFPLALMAAIVRHHVLDISVAVRLGVQYVLAKNALRAVIGGPIGILAMIVVTNPDATLRSAAASHPLLVAMSVAGIAAMATRTRLMRAVDRRFYREAIDGEGVLHAMLDDIDALETSPAAVERIAAKLERALHPASIAVAFYDRVRQRCVVAHASGDVVDAGREIDLTDSAVELLERHARATSFRDLGAGAGLSMRDAAPPGMEIVVPMVGRDRHLRGVLLLGPKRSEQPYLSGEVALLQRVARQMAAVREHGELRHLVELEHAAAGRPEELRECPVCGRCYDDDRQRCDSDAADLLSMRPLTRTIVSRYRLERVIGRGGMGTVYEAVDQSLNRRVAIKLILELDRAGALRRFWREARAVARLNHPSIVAVFDFGEISGHGAYLVMELVRGRTLREELNGGGQPPPAASARWIAQLFDAVAAAHAQGVIHRDLKPENVIIGTGAGREDRVRVVDFGLARLRAGSAEDALTVSLPGTILGTLGYMAPEQLLGRATDERTDLFALGLIAYEILTGQQPFSAYPPVRLIEVSRGLPAAAVGDRRLRDALAGCLHEEPADRYASVVEAGAAILPEVIRYVEAVRPAAGGGSD